MGRVASFEVSYRGTDLRHPAVACGGEVTRREGSTIELALWTKNADGDTTTTGAAVIKLDDPLGSNA